MLPAPSQSRFQSMRINVVAQMTRRLSHRVTVSAISLLFGTAAQGSYYPGHMDPGGNGKVPGFNGNVVFNIPSSCIPEGGTGWEATNYNTAFCGGCGNASVYSATAFLYSTAPGDPPTPGRVLDQFTLGTNMPDGLLPSTFNILGVYFFNGALAGVDTNAMGAVPGSSFYSSDTFWLQFVSGHCPRGCTTPGQFGVDPVYLSENNVDNISPPGGVTFGPPCTDPNHCTVGTAPEPGTLGLILAALGGGWLARRRGRNAAAKSP